MTAMTATSDTAIQTPLIVAVDDEPNILNALRRCLRPTGADFTAFDSGAAALAALPSREPALIISDMRMPNMDGAEFLSRAREIHPHALRILLTGHSDYERAMSAVNEGGIWRHLAKPWNDQELVSCVKQALHMRSLVAEKARLEALTRVQRDELQVLNRSLDAKVQVRTKELSDANAKIGRNFSTLVKILSSIVDARFSGGRTRRIAEVARRAAVQLNLSTVDCDHIQRAALLHPIGRMPLPDSLLSTPRDQLTVGQIPLWRAYPVNGEEMLMALEDLRPEAAIIRSHCERFDGLGFPDHLAEEAIPMGARVLAAAIVFDQILGGAALDDHSSASRAAQEMLKQAGRRLCPKACNAIVAAFGVQIGHADPAGRARRVPAVEFIDDDEILGPKERQLDRLGLQPGMELSRDALAPTGTLLLAAGHSLTATVIAQLERFEERHGTKMQFWVVNAMRGASK